MIVWGPGYEGSLALRARAVGSLSGVPEWRQERRWDTRSSHAKVGARSTTPSTGGSGTPGICPSTSRVKSFAGGAGALDIPTGLCHFESLKVYLLQGLLMEPGPRNESEGTDDPY